MSNVDALPKKKKSGDSLKSQLIYIPGIYSFPHLFFKSSKILCFLVLGKLSNLIVKF